MRLFILIFIVTLVEINAQLIQSTGLLQAEEFDCPTDVRLRENDCNKCFCTSDGELACTGYNCPENYGKGLENCNLGTSWMKGCEKCWCITIGQVCTDTGCDKDIIIKR